MRIYEATVKGRDSKDPDYEGHRWSIGVLDEKEQDLYGECETEDDYNKLIRKLTKRQYDDTNIDFYVGADEVDLEHDKITSDDYIFTELFSVL